MDIYIRRSVCGAVSGAALHSTPSLWEREKGGHCRPRCKYSASLCVVTMRSTTKLPKDTCYLPDLQFEVSVCISKWYLGESLYVSANSPFLGRGYWMAPRWRTITNPTDCPITVLFSTKYCNRFKRSTLIVHWHNLMCHRCCKATIRLRDKDTICTVTYDDWRLAYLIYILWGDSWYQGELSFTNIEEICAYLLIQ